MISPSDFEAFTLYINAMMLSAMLRLCISMQKLHKNIFSSFLSKKYQFFRMLCYASDFNRLKNYGEVVRRSCTVDPQLVPDLSEVE